MSEGRLKRVRLKFERDFTQIPNEWLRDPKLSLKARGLLALMMSHDEGWSITYKALVATNPEGQAALVAAVDELKRERYLVVNKQRGYGGKITGWTWELTDPAEEKRRSTPELDFPHVDSPHVGEPDVDNPLLKEQQTTRTLKEVNGADHSTRAGTNEDALTGDAPSPAAESEVERYERLVHESCRFFSRPRQHDWAPSGYCSNCGTPRPSLRPDDVLELTEAHS